MSALHRYLRALGCALRTPRSFFAEHEFAEDGAVTVLTVVLVAGALVAGFLLLGSIMSSTIDATVLIDNPDRPPEWVCDRHGDDPDSMRYDSCQEPEQVERDMGELLGSLVTDRLHWAPIGVAVVWIGLSILLHAGARLAGGEGHVGDSVTVVGWSLPVELARLAAGLVALWWAFETHTFSGDPQRAASEMNAAVGSVEVPLLLVSIGVIAWQWQIWRCGLETRHDLSRPAAAGVAGAVAVVPLLVAAT